MHRLVQTNLNRSDHLAKTHLKHHAVSRRGSIEIRKYQRVDVFSVKAAERIVPVADLAVERIVNLHLAVDAKVGITLLQHLHRLMHRPRRLRTV